jgi:hypothetical protein
MRNLICGNLDHFCSDRMFCLYGSRGMYCEQGESLKCN